MHALMVLLLLVGVPKPKPDAPKPEAPKGLEKLQGVWKLTALERRGAQMALDGLANRDRYTLVVVGDGFAFYTQGGTLKVDPAKQAVDLINTEGRYQGITVPGLYELKDDTLRIIMASPLAAGERPTELKTGGVANQTLYTFARDVKTTKEQAAEQLKQLK